MIDSLHILNYRNLNGLKINSFGRLNLITGKNNTGKSTVLEAIALYASKGDFSQIYQFLIERGEHFRRLEESKNPAESNIKTLSSLFTNRKVSFEKIDTIAIGIIENSLFGDVISNDSLVTIGFVRYFDDVQRDENGSLIRRNRVVLDEDDFNINSSSKIGFQVKSNDKSYLLPLEEELRSYRLNIEVLGINENIQFIRTRNIDRDINSKLWDNITLTENEQYVIEALKIIEPLTERIAFIEESKNERTAVIKLSGVNQILPLKSMGDGINRILTIILALVNSGNGFLLIDEFENGLHYSIQEKLWTIINHLAEKLNVQVFTTTHSEDCIKGFENIINTSNSEVSGKLIRLENKNGMIKQVEFSAKELKIATDNDIEIR